MLDRTAAIGIDVGTSSTKACLFDASGHILGRHAVGYELRGSAQGAAEQDPDEITAAVIAAITGAVSEAGTAANDVGAVGFGAAMHSLIAVDAEGGALTPSFTWADTRALSAARHLAETTDGTALYVRTGTPVHPMSPLSKLVWLARERPQVVRRAARFVGIKEYVFFKLFGRWVTDQSTASATGLFNIHTLDWDEEALRLAGIGRARLPEITVPSAVIAGLPASLAVRLGIPAAIPVVAGASDGVLATIGLGATRPMSLHPVVAAVTQRIRRRSASSRAAYLARVEAARFLQPRRACLSCANLAHGTAAFEDGDRARLLHREGPNIAIISAYNDMLSAHQPYVRFPDIIKRAVREAGGVAQFAGGVPAMCDGITQGQVGMELSLFSRDVIALATAVALSHNMFDGALCLGICDKIVPGLLIGVLSFGHLPVVFVPAGPMPTGIGNEEKVKIRQLYAQHRVDGSTLLQAETRSYHAPGTCTFYGTANSNQMLMEVMGLHLPAASFVNPNTPLRDALTAAAARRVVEISALGDDYRPVGRIVDEKAMVNAIVALLATGGSTNHTMHLVAIARAAGLRITWDDFDDLSTAVPLLARLYPNGTADVNQFREAGDVGFLIAQLLAAGLLHDDTLTVIGNGLADYRVRPVLEGAGVSWQPAPPLSGDESVLRSCERPFAADGGLRVLNGNLGRAVIKVSAVKPEHQRVEAPAVVFDSQRAFLEAFNRGELRRDFVAVVRYQGPRANGIRSCTC